MSGVDTGPPTGETIRVLHVDDEPGLGDTVAAFLERANDRLRVETATSAEEGLDLIADREFDCVVSDYEMSGTNGIAFLEAIRATRPDLPFVLYTGKGSEEVASEAITAGATDYLQKEAGTDHYAVLANRIVNVVERERAQASMGEIQRLFTELANSANDLLWLFSSDWNELVFVSDAYESLYGQPRAVLERDPGAFLDAIHPDDRERVERAMEALSDGESIDIEYRINETENYERHVWVKGDPITDAEGTVTHVGGFSRDITDRRGRERVLREMYEVIADRDRSFDEQVRALLELGRAQLDIDYGTLSRVHGDEYVFEIVDADDDVVREGDVVPVSSTNCEIAIETERTLVFGDIERDAPGEIDPAGFTDLDISRYLGAPVFVDGDVYGTFCFYGTEARTEQFSEWEVTLVELMSRWVSYELQHQRANERLSRFTSIVSHDLRNPLNVAEGSIELFEETGDTDRLSNARRALDRMSALIDDLLVLAQSGGTVDDPSTLDLGAVVERSWANVPTEAATLRVETERTVHADGTRLQQLFENLHRNAVEHGGGAVTVTVGDLADGFYVEDDGSGIPTGDREAVFEGGYSTATEGTGFGLAIVREVADAHGWDVRVTDGPADGARFEFTGVASGE